jgi:hypothetical protein
MNPLLFSVGENFPGRPAIRRLLPCVVWLVIGSMGWAAPERAKPSRADWAEPSGRAPGAAQLRVEFAALSFDFGRVKQGEVVRHDFVFTNTGTAVLELTSVTPRCGCTTAGDWDRQLAPGRTGAIPLQLRSAGFSGPISKTATVTCNDPRQPTLEREFKAAVWTPFTLTPAIAVFTVSDETAMSETKVVRIVNHQEEPVTLSGVESGSPSFRAELTTVIPGREFRLRITAVPPYPAAAGSALITVQTSSPETPTLKVLAQWVGQRPVVVQPERLLLPAGPLPAAVSQVITVRNNGSHRLVLSEASVNVPGAEVRAEEVPGTKLFQITVKFPAGFRLPPEDGVEVSVKSNHPEFADIRVPVVAQPAAASAQVTATGGKSPAAVLGGPGPAQRAAGPKD